MKALVEFDPKKVSYYSLEDLSSHRVRMCSTIWVSELEIL